MSALEKYVCHICDVLPRDEKLFRCHRNHILCNKCCFTSLAGCSCGSINVTAISNPLVKAIEPKVIVVSNDYCPYKNDGCSWVFTETSEFEAHIMECKFRPYRCIGLALDVWKCDWQGLQQNLSEHIKTSHSDASKFYNYFQNGSVPFSSNRTISKINLIDAFNKKFVFYYLSKSDNPNVLFIIFLLGRKCDAQKYLIDFELKQNYRKVKFVELCYSDAENVKDLVKDEHCFSISKKLVKTFLTDNEINFRFIIKRKETFQAEEQVQEEHLQNMLAANRIDIERIASNMNSSKNKITGNGSVPNRSNHSRNSSVSRHTPTQFNRNNNGNRSNAQVDKTNWRGKKEINTGAMGTGSVSVEAIIKFDKKNKRK